MSRELLQQALDALERVRPQVRGAIPVADVKDGIAALREALAAPEQEPVARCILDNGDEMGSVEWLVRPRSIRLDHGSLLYAAPPAAPAVPLQGGMDNNELLAAWQKKLPGRTPEGQELSAFAVGTEVGFEHAQRLERMDWDRVHHVLAKHGKHPGRTDDHLADVIDKALSATPPAAPADDHATPSGGQEAGPQEDRIEAAYWRFDARHKGYSQWKTAPMSKRDAFKAEMRNALEAEKVRAEMRLVARGWRRPDAPAAPAPAAPVPDGWVMVPKKELGDGITLLHQAMVGACDCLTKTHEAKYHAESCFYRRLSEQCDKLEATITAAPAQPAVPLTDSELAKIAVEDEFLLYCDQDSFNEIARAIELAHGITGASK